MSRPRVLLIRGHQANSWHLRPWKHLHDEFEVHIARTRRTWFDLEAAGSPTVEAPTLRDRLPRGRIGDLLSRVPGDRYLRPADLMRGYDIVHSQDLVFWYSAQAARLKDELGFKHVMTCWETIPFLDAYRNVRTRPYRRAGLHGTDLFLAATERARRVLLLEGADPARVRVCPPGADDQLIRSAPPAQPREHLVLTAGRLVWEKGHQDVLRAVAALVHGAVPGLPHGAAPRVLVVGAGPEAARLRRHAQELGIEDRFELRREVPYSEMPAVYAEASCLVLGSLPTTFWEEQFGMVMIEALHAQLPVIAAASGAIPEVLGGRGELFPAGDWEELARRLAVGPLAQPPGTRRPVDADRYTGRAFADRLRDAYRGVLA